MGLGQEGVIIPVAMSFLAAPAVSTALNEHSVQLHTEAQWLLLLPGCPK